MTTPNNQPTPPPEYEILTDYTKPLPERSKEWSFLDARWFTLSSAWVGTLPVKGAIYAVPITQTERDGNCPDCAGEPCDAHSPHPSPGEQPCEQREELKPCPFCGGAPRIEQGINEADQAWRIFCANPDCTVIVECQSGFTKEDNINRWNTRS